MRLSLPRWARILGILLLTALGLFVFFAWLFKPLLPFIIALALAKLMEPPVRALHKRLRLPRSIGALLVTLLGIAVLLGIVFFISSWALREANKLIEQMPYFMTKLPDLLNTWRVKTNAVIEAAPPSAQDYLRSAMENLLTEGAAVPAMVYNWLVGFVAWFIGAAPSAGLFLFATVLSTYLMSRDYPRLTTRILSPFSRKIREKILQTKDQALQTMGKWFRAQVYLMGLTFLILLAGFLILRVEVALLPAVVIALLDALPVIGAGFCLIPWMLFSLFGGATGTAIGLLIIYAIIVVTRSVVEPRLVGHQIGMDPLVTFGAMYIGFKMLGVLGVVLFPILAAIIRQVVMTILPVKTNGGGDPT